MPDTHPRKTEWRPRWYCLVTSVRKHGILVRFIPTHYIVVKPFSGKPICECRSSSTLKLPNMMPLLSAL